MTDRAGGPPDAAGTAARRPRILVVRRRYLGDLILTEPFLRNLREAYPEAWIAVVVDEGYGEVLRGCSSIDEIVEIPRGRRSPHSAWRAWKAFLRGVAGTRYDLSFDFARNERAALAILLSRARRRVSFEIEDDAAVRRRKPTDILRRRLMSTDLLRLTRAEQEPLHTVDFGNRLLEPLGLPALHRVPRLAVSPADRDRARALLGRSSDGGKDRPRVVVHPGGRGGAKRWPAERFARVADALEADFGCEIVLVGGPGEEDLVHEVARARTRKGGVVLAEPLPLGVAYAVLAECDLFVGNDSGPAHMAAAVGTPTCVLFGDPQTSMWHTLGEHDEFLQPDLPCGDACVAPGTCAPGARYCVRRIATEDVVASASRILGRIAPDGQRRRDEASPRTAGSP